MPTYSYRCGSCSHEFDRLLPIARYDEPQGCPECEEAPAKKLITAGGGFILKGDGWASKDGRVNKQMREKNRKLDAKQAEMKRDAPGMTLAPNVAGQRVGSWSEASKLARSKGKDTSGYDARARKEKK